MKLGTAAVATLVVAIASSGCGSSSTSSGETTAKASTASSGTGSVPTTLPPGTPAALRGAHGAMLRAGELPGFVPQGYRAPSTSPQSWVAEFPPGQRASEAARLKALGFVAGVGERLAPTQAGAPNREGISLVEQFRSAHGANGEIANQLKQAVTRGESTFAVAGIPGAGGFGSSNYANVAFSVGAYYYLVGFSSGGASTPTRSQLITAAQSLYRRVRG